MERDRVLIGGRRAVGSTRRAVVARRRMTAEIGPRNTLKTRNIQIAAVHRTAIPRRSTAILKSHVHGRSVTGRYLRAVRSVRFALGPSAL